MKKFLLAGVCAALALLCGTVRALSTTGDPLRVVTTIPDLADIVTEIGGERVKVTSICKGRENLHAVQAKPSHMVALSRADLFFEIGLSLEIAFVPGLLENCGNAKVKVGGPGFVNVSEGWEALAVPTSLSRQAGDVHPQGNPHLNLDPRAGTWIADKVLAALVANDPGSKPAYELRYADYKKRLDEAAQRWAKQAAAWKGLKFVEYHQEFEYLAAQYGIEIAGKVESKPGIPPTPNHIAELIAAMKKDGVKLIVSAPWSSGRDVEQLAAQTGAKVVELPNQCGGLPGTETWIGMMDVMHTRLAAGFGTPEKP
jgi:zinc/manganese transport system substrate-binding protein